jgi:TATA-box binding protein (TBP) (component of TFIID and TFIIIB)
MQHLSENHELNAYVTTVTSHVRLHPSEDGVYVTPTRLYEAVEKLRESGIGVKKSFKNCSIIWVAVNSKRASRRSHNVSVKIFKNMMLHITGAHSLEMIQVVVEKLCDILSKFLDVSLKQRGDLRVTMVNYKYVLPGRVNLSKLVRQLLNHGTLVIFDPSNYAGARVKVPIPDSRKTASIMIFESGKVIIIMPETKDRDDALSFIRDFIDQKIVLNWNFIQLEK